MKTSLEYMREYHERNERTAECVVCSTVFKTYYQQKKTCSKDCSAVLREKTKRKGQPERLARWRSNPENRAKEREATKIRSREIDRTEYRKKYYAENKEKVNKAEKEWRMANPERARVKTHNRRAKEKSIGKINYFEYLKKKKLFDGCCYCGSHHDLTIEHLVPVSRMGTNSTHNLFPACSRCNSSKNKKDFLEWYRNQSFYNPIKEFKILQNTFAG